MKIVDVLSLKLLMSNTDIVKFANTAPHRYKVYQIPKRNSSKKRTIAQPSKELKFLQRILCGILEDILPIHNSAFAYKKNIGIKQNAEFHSKNKFLLKMDFKNFFPSINPNLFLRQIESHAISLDEVDKKLLINLIFRKPYREGILELSIGAPSSPLISNFIMYNFDKAISEKCNSMSITYTRYADDITFSTNSVNILFNIPKIVESLLHDIYQGDISLNKEKTVFSSKAHNRHVTGITLSNDSKLSIGRYKKRVLSSKIHHYLLGHLKEDEIQKLKGELAFSFHIEPILKKRFIRKYGKECFLKLDKEL
ncbi:RNA-dependent DNA polymerase [Rodentibacter pneumotropicus]|uniref:RNA-directed DNA polymerase n=1 Tax=Rodentibacter pneumotropicus TaxID=758 RepID=A0AAW5LGI2_9PAST|nr:retron St85 family RNA-directed DNA polymerase [Rodentibacter pneumotropicus]MCQ9122066.1 retron St85 family RNA-directed DNA polymerase [Rodentibacter pneumotropicus]OOF67400.1 RNA-dependent DNA polymerase [Rodentibacter pneumotropicus]